MRKVRVSIRYELYEGKDIIEDCELYPLTVSAQTISSAIRKVAQMVTVKA